jgi:hypothetical protein
MEHSDGDQPAQLESMPHETGLFGGMTSQQVIRPLWFVLIGGVMCCISAGIKIGTYRLSDQPVGALLITIGVWQLSRIDVGRDYMLIMRSIVLVAFLQIVGSVSDVFPPSQDPLMALLHIFLSLASIASGIAFGYCMGWFCQDTRLWRSAKRWQQATIVFWVCGCLLAVVEFLFLLIILNLIQLPQPFGGQAGFPWWPWYLALVPFIVLPWAALLRCILQMDHDMERRGVREAVENVSLSPNLRSLGG